VAAVAFACRRRRKLLSASSGKNPDLEMPLLADANGLDANGQQLVILATTAATSAHTSDAGAGAGGCVAVTVVPAPVQVAEYEEGTGAPLNKVAKAELALLWRTGAVAAAAAAAAGGAAKPPRMVRLPFAELEGATQGFSDFNMLGGGASCAVFKGCCFGVPVAVKRLSLVANAGATDQKPTSDWEVRQLAVRRILLLEYALTYYLPACLLAARPLPSYRCGSSRRSRSCFAA
jgi:hypothetical protein